MKSFGPFFLLHLHLATNKDSIEDGRPVGLKLEARKGGEEKRPRFSFKLDCEHLGEHQVLTPRRRKEEKEGWHLASGTAVDRRELN